MKSTDEFWNVIATYNLKTIEMQVLFSVLLISTLLFSFFKNNRKISNSLNSLFTAIFFFIGISFFLITDRSVTAMFFGPLFIVIGFLFLFELYRSKAIFQSPTPVQYLLYALALCYPIVSYGLNHHYPKQVLYILPCPIVSLALITYSRLYKRNDLLNILLIIWGLTGVKAFIFDVKEDLILLVVGIYGLIDYINYKRSEQAKRIKNKTVVGNF